MTIIKCIRACSLFCFLLVLLPSVKATEFQLADKNLQACVYSLAKKHKWENAADVDNIVCHNKGIESLKGIEQFTNVQKLSFHKNDITEVKLSNLAKLRELNLARNRLQKMELNQLPALTNLYFFGNQIPKVELKDLPELSQIKANSSKIVVFEYQGLPNLEKIYLFDNQIELLDIYHFPAMKYMDVRQNPMSDELYEEMDKLSNMTILHDGNAEDWQ